MKVSYRGIKQALPAKLQSKLDTKFAKLSKLLEKRGEQEAHVVVTLVRHLHKAEITIQFYDHKLVAISSNTDLFTALSEALEKLEAQAVKNRGKWRESHRRMDGSSKESSAMKRAGEAEAAPKSVKAKPSPTTNVFKVNHHDSRKPMTLDEAMIEMEQDRDYVVYRDAEKERVSVLVRRRDGHFDLIEG